MVPSLFSSPSPHQQQRSNKPPKQRNTIYDQHAHLDGQLQQTKKESQQESASRQQLQQQQLDTIHLQNQLDLARAKAQPQQPLTSHPAPHPTNTIHPTSSSQDRQVIQRQLAQERTKQYRSA